MSKLILIISLVIFSTVLSSSQNLKNDLEKLNTLINSSDGIAFILSQDNTQEGKLPFSSSANYKIYKGKLAVESPTFSVVKNGKSTLIADHNNKLIVLRESAHSDYENILGLNVTSLSNNISNKIAGDLRIYSYESVDFTHVYEYTIAFSVTNNFIKYFKIRVKEKGSGEEYTSTFLTTIDNIRFEPQRFEDFNIEKFCKSKEGVLTPSTLYSSYQIINNLTE